MITIWPTNDPEAAFTEWMDEFARGAKIADALALDYAFTEHYLPEAPDRALVAILAIERADSGMHVALSVAEKNDALIRGLNCLRANRAAVREWAEQHGLPWLELSRPLRLQPVMIPKPWGREVWYTGIEARGQSQVVDDRGRALPLPWLLSLCSRYLLGKSSWDIILLKVLDPLPQPVFGDLYFEMHEEKREVYVVAHVDESAWPTGTGGIRFGFDQDKRTASGSDNAFKNDYLAAVNAYRVVRLRIDDYLDDCRRDSGVALDAPVDPETARQWLAGIPRELREEEVELRAAMEAFIHTDPLRVGDVVKVPCYTPHSLLHGVRTVEFQTPVYERKILSFAQKVLTQGHWDTASALEQIALDSPPKSKLPLIASDDNVQIEEVADFEDFRVERLTLKAGRTCMLDSDGRYCLLMGVTGELVANDVALGPEQAVLVPATKVSLALRCDAHSDVIALLARPKA